MSRSGKTKKRTLSLESIHKTDSIYHNLLVTKFINTLMRDGKKTVAQRQLFEAFAVLKKKGENPLQVFEKALQNVGPRMEVRPRRIGGASYQIPIEVRLEKKTSLAIRWIRDAAAKRSNREYHTFGEKLSAELLDASQNQGEAIKKRDMMHRMAEANRAFAHFRW